MRSSKSRSRNKNRNRPQGGGNIVSRVFDSSGPEGKVRGTPAQIIEKYGQLARDAQLSGDRVALENFQQHSEHYTRMLAAAQKEIDARQVQGGQGQGGQNSGGQNNGGQNYGGQNQNGQNQPQNAGSGNYQGSDNQNGGQDNGNRSRYGQNNTSSQGGNEPRQQPEARQQPELRQDNSRQQEPRAQDEARGPSEQPRAPRVNRRRERNADGDERGSDQARAPVDDVVDMPERDMGPVETPENATPSPKADKPRRTRTRKKAPASSDATETGGADEKSRAEDPAA